MVHMKRIVSSDHSSLASKQPADFDSGEQSVWYLLTLSYRGYSHYIITEPNELAKVLYLVPREKICGRCF